MPQDIPAELQLHDATLVSIEFIWQEAICKLIIEKWSKVQAKSVSVSLEFSGVTNLVIPKQEDWGPSESINKTNYQNGVCVIEMQSGDQITIAASGYKIVAL